MDINWFKRDSKLFKVVLWAAVVYVTVCIYLLYSNGNQNETVYVFLDENMSFMDSMKMVSWDSYKSAILHQNQSEIQRYSSSLLSKLVKFLVRSPKVPINESCKAPLFQMPVLPEKLLLCKPLLQNQAPRKLGILWQLGFDVDALEVHLNELDSVVDKFFILESIQAHSSYIKSKPLIWDMIKDDKRFAKFSGKVVHFVVDDASLSSVNASDIWSRENQQERLRWMKFLEWNNGTGFFGDADLLGFGDVDEIPNRNDVMFLKNCHLDSNFVDIGIWFPFDGVTTLFSTDYPVKGHPYTLGDPTFWTLKSAKEYFKSTNLPPSRMSVSNSIRMTGACTWCIIDMFALHV